MKFIIATLSFIIISTSVTAQTDWVKWGKADISYQLQGTESKKYSIDKSNFGSILFSGLQTGYYLLVSNYDGDNCPFYPSCSFFFVESVKQTNIFQGALMFADRFMRDTNIFKRSGFYPVHNSGRLYDPVTNYKLRKDEIKFIPRDEIVD